MLVLVKICKMLDLMLTDSLLSPYGHISLKQLDN